MSNWTDEQLSAIKVRDCSVIVSAAAGSGKTSVLVERLINIIADSEKQLPVEKMIVVTFTKAAAAEMRQRLSVSLSKLIEKDPENDWLARQNTMLGCAAISTISSFCMELLRKNICSLSFSSGFRISDEAEESILKKQAYNNTSDYFYRERYNDMLKLRNNFCGTNDYQLEKIVYELYECISSAPFFDLWLDGADEKYKNGQYQKEYERIIQGKLQDCITEYRNAEAAAGKLDSQKISDLIRSDKKFFENALEILKTKGYYEFYKEVSKISFARFPGGKKSDDAEIVHSYRDSYKQYISEIKEKLSVYCNFANDINKCTEILDIMSDFLKQFDKELLALKESKNVIGFNDAERLVLRLLAEIKENGEIVKTPLAEELSDYYDLIMIDEFQDSNNRQDMIFRLLSKGGSSEEYGNNLFFVGDVKQSIYRFRLANPDNFINAVKKSKPYEKGNKEMSCIRLSKNFRSSKEVIDFSNYIFSCIMSDKCGDIDYNSEEYLYEGASFCDGDRKPVIMLYDKSDSSTEASEAKFVAEKISQMLNDKVPVSCDGGKSSRPCQMNDFCILMRGNKEIKTYAEELGKLGINAEGNAEPGYLRSREISVLVNLLKVVDNPLLDMPIMSVMLSPMFMFTPDEAAEVRLVDRKASLYMNICKGIGLDESEQPVFKDALLEKAKALYSIITELRLYVSAYNLQELIRRIYDVTDFMSVIQLYGNGKRKKANLRMMLEYAGNYEKNNDGGLPGFIRYIDHIMDSESDLGAVSDSAGVKNAVSIKTMHKSKGLEYPFVFIVGTEKKFNTQDSKNLYQFSYDLGLGFKIQEPVKFERYKTLPYELIKTRNRLDFISEEMRLLYVAMTRARERLFITMNCGESAVKKAVDYAKKIYAQQGITAELAASASSMGDWLMMCMTAHSKSARLREFFGIYESFRYSNDFEVEYEMFKPKKAEEDSIKESAAVHESADSDMVRKLEEMFSFEYDMSLSALTAKMSVSDMSKETSESFISLRRPELSGEAGELTPAEKGTALHKFFQFAAFKNLEKDINAEKERLYHEGYLTAKQRDSINEKDVKAFLDSRLYARINQAKKVYREKKFLIAIDDLGLNNEYGEEYKSTMGMVNGIIDMVLEFDDHLVLVDYKTDRVSDINELAERYSSQLELYKKTLEQTETLPVTETLIYSFYKKDELSILNSLSTT